ncbi:lipid II flippase MurJ [Pedobacter metabolipauper]|nr:lipid II flippase MurJ [Pedobacter metabolipauper]
MGITIFTLSLSAKYFGVSLEKDVWVLALNCIIILDLAIWGPFNETFRAKFIFFKEEFGEDEALRRTNSLLIFTNIITIILVAFILWKPETIAAVIAPGYEGQKLTLLLFMIRVVAPSFLFNQLTQIFISILNAYNSIYIPEIAGFISSIISLLLIIFLAPQIGIIALAYSYYSGLILLLLLLILQVYVKKIALVKNLHHIKLSDTKPFLLFALPFFFPYFVGQIAGIIEKSIASTLGTGIISAIDYSRKFSDILLGVLSSVFTTMLLPVLSLKFVQKDQEGFVFEFRQIYQLAFLIVTAIAAIFTACPGAFIAILYQQGTISEAALLQISNLTMFYSWSAVSIFLYLIIGMSLISAQKGKYYAFYGVTAQLIMIGVNLALYRFAGVYIFPLSLFLAHALSAWLMFRKLPYGKRLLSRTTLKYLLILIAVVANMYLLNINVISFSSPYVTLIFNGFLFTVILVSMLFTFKLDEREILVKLYNKFLVPQK